MKFDTPEDWLRWLNTLPQDQRDRIVAQTYLLVEAGWNGCEAANFIGIGVEPQQERVH